MQPPPAPRAGPAAKRGAGASADDWARRDAAVVWHGFTQMAAWGDNEPVIVERAEGRFLIDVEGRRYLDAISSLWVNTLGHRVPELDAALVEQAGRVAHSTMLGNGNAAVVELAEDLAKAVPVDEPHFLFASDGASAVEQALKIAFQYQANLGRPERRRFLALGDAYHGDSLGALSVGDGGFGTELFDPLRFPVLRAPGYRDQSWLDQALTVLRRHGSELAAAIIEPLVQGAAGMLVADPEDVGELGAACQEAGVLLICDEVATGFGRTGSLFASDQCGLRPDLLCLGKGITGGYLPMSATVAAGPVFDAFLGEDLGGRTFYHGHSYGGNALAAAVARRHLALLHERDVLANVAARGAQLGEGLQTMAGSLAVPLEIRRRGLMCGVEICPPPGVVRCGRRVAAAAVRRGVLLRPIGDVIVIVPPLTISADEVELIVAALAEAIAEVCE